jgi:hypothetical protein
MVILTYPRLDRIVTQPAQLGSSMTALNNADGHGGWDPWLLKDAQELHPLFSLLLLQLLTQVHLTVALARLPC